VTEVSFEGTFKGENFEGNSFLKISRSGNTK
jgi:hypothetical protein